MESAAYVALSSQMALSRQLEVVANNMANASTPAFKAQRALFAEFLNRNPSGTTTSFVQDFGTARDTTQGPLTQTGNPLDIALKGDGYLKLQTPLGIRYTRNGRFQLDANGAIVNPQGYALLGSGDQPINIPANSRDVTITTDGTVSTNLGEAGKVAVAAFADERQLTPAAGGVYVTDATPTAAKDTTVQQGVVEESNVQPIIEMTRLMGIARNFGYAKDFGDGESDRARNAIDKLGKVA